MSGEVDLCGYLEWKHYNEQVGWWTGTYINEPGSWFFMVIDLDTTVFLTGRKKLPSWLAERE